MSTPSRSNHLRDTIPGVPGLIDTAKTYKQGQFVMRATVGGVVKIQPALLNTDGPNVVGVAEFTDPPESLPGGSEEPRPLGGTFRHTGIFLFVGKSGETYKPFDPVVLDDGVADGQSIRKQGGDGFANVVGLVDPFAPAAGLAGGAGANIPIWICPPALGRNSGTAPAVLI